MQKHFLKTPIKNNVSIIKRLKKFHKRETFLRYKLLASLDYPSTLDCKEVFLTILNISYTDCPILLLCILLLSLTVLITTLSTSSIDCQRLILYSSGENIFSVTAKKKSQIKRKTLKVKEKGSTQKKNYQLKKSFSTKGKICSISFINGYKFAQYHLSMGITTK